MKRLIGVTVKEDIFPAYRNTPIELLLEYHNLNRPFENYSQAQLLIGMCIDNRKRIRIPENFAFVVRSGGVNLRHSEFNLSYAVAIGGVRSIALIGHTQCGMMNLQARQEAFVRGLVDNAGWEKEQAEEHFTRFWPLFEIGNEIDSILSEAKRLKFRYPRVQIAPLIYQVEDNLLYQIEAPS